MAQTFQTESRHDALREYFRLDHEDRLAFCRLVWPAAILFGATTWLSLYRVFT